MRKPATSLCRSWRIAELGLAFFRAQPKMLLFPVLSAILSFGTAVALYCGVAAPLELASDRAFYQASEPFGQSAAKTAWALIAFLYVLLVSVITTFFTVALAVTALDQISGRNASFSRAIKRALSRSGAIVGYGSVVLLFQSVLFGSRGFVGRWFLSEFARSSTSCPRIMATFIVAPVIAAEEGSPWHAIRRIVWLIETTWNSNLARRAGFTLLFLCSALGTGLVAGVPCLILLEFTSTRPIAHVGFALIAIALAGLFLALQALETVYSAAMYHYAMTGKVPDNIADELVIVDPRWPTSVPTLGGSA